DHRLPLRARRAEGRERRAPPDPALVDLVLPEVVDDVAEKLRRRDLLLRVEDLERALVDRLILRLRLEHGDGLLALRLGPCERLPALDVLEPLKVVGGRRGTQGGERREKTKRRHGRTNGVRRRHASTSKTCGS